MTKLGTRHDSLHPDMTKRTASIEKDTQVMYDYFIKLQVNDARQTRNGLNVTDVRGTPLGSYIIVYR